MLTYVCLTNILPNKRKLVKISNIFKIINPKVLVIGKARNEKTVGTVEIDQRLFTDRAQKNEKSRMIMR